MNPRRQFLHAALLGTAAAAVSPLFAQTTAVPSAPAPTPRVPDRGPPLEDALVKEFVVAAHGDLAKTQSMLAAQPHLLNATWDWGGGDFETALGGASHMGRRDIAEFLLQQGARADVFALAMLGHLDAVKAFFAARPETAKCVGPHGIPLLAHARKGGAKEVVAYLQSLAR